jgi:Fe-S cluster biogenesis protein NfuA/nitrite reductase/ring-hydroxylating ferredoxin subunit
VDDTQAVELVGRVESLLEQLESLPDPASRDGATEVVQALLDLYGEALERIVDCIAERDSGGMAQALAADELVSHILLLHGLHPVPLEQRVRSALGEVRPYLESHGGNVELMSVEDGVVALRLAGSCSGCPSSAMTLKLAIEEAIYRAAPDVREIDAEGTTAASAPALLQIEVPESMRAGTSQWAMAGGMPELRHSGPLLKTIAGERLLFLNLAGSFYAYRPRCPACDDRLEDAALEGTQLVCTSCGSRYDPLRAGRCLDTPDMHLEPVPLLVDESGLVKVALGAAA